MDIVVSVVGVRSVVVSDSGVSGYQLYYNYPLRDGDGLGCASVFVSNGKLETAGISDARDCLDNSVRLSLYKYGSNKHYSCRSISLA